MVFQVNYTEKLCGSYIFEADSEEDAIAKFESELSAGKVDILDMDVVDSYAKAVVVGREDKNGAWVYDPSLLWETMNDGGGK